ncbi:MAG: transferrin-binding protein-like solute binding protein, partial [Alphaproteobacteria bacterium]|nr:transferrin-binding protein-like solute binding protein [Alphaproteobacteria bacterium]
MQQFIFSVITLVMFSPLLIGCGVDGVVNDAVDCVTDIDAALDICDNSDGNSNNDSNNNVDNNGSDVNNGGSGNNAVSVIQTTYADTPQRFNQNRLTSFNDETRNNKNDNALPALSVQIIKNTDNATITANRITGSVFEFDYDATGAFVDDGLRFYFADKKYQTSNNSSDNNIFELKTQSEFFGFATNYMALIQWSETENDDKTQIYAITGYETDDIKIPITGKTIFNGKGQGTYYSSNASYDTIFDVTANVDFSNYAIHLTGTNTCIALCTEVANQKYDLNFNGLLNYQLWENIITGAIQTVGGNNIAQLSGNADARFYGNAVPEFGGTFAMLNDNASYIGYFGAIRGYIISPNKTIRTIHADTPQTFNQNRLTSFNDDARNSTTNNALPIIAVQIIKNTDNETISSASITGAAVEFDYQHNGKFTHGGLRLYFANKKYEISSGIGSTDYIDAASTTSNIDANPSSFAIDKRAFAFGFVPAAMALVSWSVNEDNYKGKGFAITGYQTDGSDIPVAGLALFEGKGQGTYYSKNASYDTIFDVAANVNFSAKLVSLTGTNSCIASCTEVANQKYDLNFTALLDYQVGENSITGAIKTVGGNNIRQLSGTADARFYGPAAQSIGGTFSMTNNEAAYIGYFAARRGYIIVGTALMTTTHNDTPTIFNQHNLTAFNDANRHGTENNALKTAPIVEITKNNNDKTITRNKITGAVAEFDHDSNGHFADTGLTLYFADKKYEITDGNGTYYNMSGSSFESDNADNPDKFSLERRWAYFGAPHPTYMALLHWTVEEQDYRSKGFTITGYETSNDGILAHTSAIQFTGKGQGRYHSTLNDYNTEFTVKANVDFSANTVNLIGTDDDYDDLDFTASLKYQAGINAIAGTIETAGGDDFAKLSGTADARFYGPVAQSIGGTFSMTNNDAAYIGYFAARRGYITVGTALMTTTHNDTPTIFNQHNLTSLNDDARNGTKNNAFKAASIVEIIHNNNDDKTIRSNKIIGAVVEFDYKNNGEFADEGLTLYFADKKYEITDGTAYQHSINDHQTESDGPHKLTDFELFRRVFHNGFTSDHMALVTWRTQISNVNTYGYAITGFETMGNAIPRTGTSIFTGEGRGRYIKQHNNVLTYFDVKANVDFSNRTVALIGKNSYGNTGLSADFDFTSLLRYDANDNILSGDFETIGGETYEKLSGTAEARFYGIGDNAVKELGGIFDAKNNHALYVGYFVTGKNYTIADPTLMSETTHKDTPTIFNQHNLTAFNDANRHDTENNALKTAPIVEIIKNTDNETISINKINGAVVEFDHDSDGDFADKGLTLYFADKKYEITDGNGTYYNISGSSFESDNADNPDKFSLERRWAYFGEPHPTYMALLHWTVEEQDYRSKGFTITGYETSNDGILARTGAIQFTGKGRGRYHSTFNDYNTEFTVKANVDFSANTLNLVGTDDDYDDLDFTASLKYQAGENSITGAIKTVGGSNIAPLSGTADARFYGPAAQSIGGTFSMTNNEASYIGYFAARRGYITVGTALMTTTHKDTPTTFNQHNLTSLNDANRHGTENNALKTAPIVEITKNNNDKTITRNKITGAVVEFDHASNGDFADTGLTLYFADKKYEITDGNGTDYNIVGSSFESDNADNPDKFSLERRWAYFGEPHPTYMALLHWTVE